MTKNGNWLKIASLTAIGGLIITVITILSFASTVTITDVAVDERIDNKIIAHEAEVEVVRQKQIGGIQQDIAVMKIQQKLHQEKVEEDIGEIKEMIRNQ